MKNHELLNMIGDVNEDYVRAADSNVVRPRFQWKALAACAACAALVLCAYPVWQGVKSNSVADTMLPAGGAAPPLHSYTVVEGGALATYDDQAAKIPVGGADSLPEAAPAEGYSVGGAYVGDEPRADTGEDDLTMDGTYDTPSKDVPVQAAAEWYDALLRTYRLEEHPEWYGGAWLAGDELLAVAIVDGFRTPELEAEIREAAGAGAVIQFSTVKYSMEFLYGLMEPAVRALDGSGLFSGAGVDVTANCLSVDLYSDGKTISDDVLTALAHLDPDGDAIRVRLYTQTMNVLTDEVKKGPAPDAVSTPVPGGAREFPREETPSAENAQPVQYDIQLRQAEELPQAKYDVISGADK